MQITEYSQTEAALAELRQRYGGTSYEVRTAVGMAAARKGRAEIRGYRTALEAKRVEIKAPALDRCRLIDAEAKRITAELLALEEPIDAAIKEEEDRKEAERLRQAREEAERIARGRALVDEIRAPAIRMVGQSSTAIAAQIENARALLIPMDEFEMDSAEAKKVTLAKLEELHAAALVHEAEQQRIKEERAELARLKAEQVERERQEQTRIAEEGRVRAEAERAARLKIEEQERQSRERIEAEDRKARLAREAADAEASKKRDAEEAAMKVERERIEAERRAIEEKARAKQKKANQRLDARAMLARFVELYGALPEFSGVVEAINALPGDMHDVGNITRTVKR